MEYSEPWFWASSDRPGNRYFNKSLRECDLHSILRAPAVGTYSWLLWRSCDCSHSPCLPGWEWHASLLLTIMGLHWAWCWVCRHSLLIILPDISILDGVSACWGPDIPSEAAETADSTVGSVPGSYSQYTTLETWIMDSRPGSIPLPTSDERWRGIILGQ